MNKTETPLHFLSWNNTTDSVEVFSTITQEVENEDNSQAIRNMISFITYPILILFGTFGNLLVFIVMRRGSLKHVSTCFYMSILALADTGKTLIFPLQKSKMFQ